MSGYPQVYLRKDKIMRMLPARGWLISLVVIACLLPALPVAAQNPRSDTQGQRLRESFGEAYRAKKWPQAIELGLKLVELLPDNSTHAYNLACVYSLNGGVNEAAEWLGKAAERGFSEVRLFETDSDLDNVREHSAYSDALALVKENQRKKFKSLKKRFLKHAPLVFLPPKHDPNRPSPLIVALHGYGAKARGVASAWETVAAQTGAILVAPQAVHKVAGSGGFSWLRSGVTNPDEADFLIEITLKLVTNEFQIDKERMVLTGFSQGGYVALAVGARQPYKFAGVIPMAGGYIPAIDRPAKAAGDQPPRFYFMVGEHDRGVDQSRRAADDFANAGFDVKFRIYPGVSHAFPRDPIKELHDALEFVLER